MADEITVREACYQVSRPLISQKAPYIVSSFDAILFDVVYEQAQGADLLHELPLATEAGQEAVDITTLRDTALVALIVFPVFKILSGILKKTTGDMLAYSIKRLDVKAVVADQKERLLRKWPKAAPWIDIAAFACERFLINAQTELRRKKK